MELIYDEVRNVTSLEQISAGKGLGKGASGAGEKFCFLIRVLVTWMCSLRNFTKLYAYALYSFT